MTGLYQRRISPNTTSPAITVDKSQGAGGAVPHGASVSMPQQDQGIDAAQLGGLLGMIKNGGQQGVDRSGFGLSSGVPLKNDSAGTAAGDVLGGLANANNGMSYEPLPDPNSLSEIIATGWQSFKNWLPGFGA